MSEIYDRDFFNNLLNQTYEEKSLYFRDMCSVTDLEDMACKYHKLLHPYYNKGETGLLEKILLERRIKLDRHFSWTEKNKRHFLELNDKIISGFKKAYDEAAILYDKLTKKLNSNDSFLDDFNIRIKLSPFILEIDNKTGELTERGEGIYWVLYSSLPEYLWTDDIIDGRFGPEYLRFLKDDTNWNGEYFSGQFDEYYIGYGIHQLLDCHIFSWFDILRINEIWVEVKTDHQHFIENIGKGDYWDNGLQTEDENIAENIRMEYMSRLSKEESGLPVELLVDDIGAWENIGKYKRLKFKSNTDDKIDRTKMVSMSIEEHPRILVKDIEINLSDDELKQIKAFISGNEQYLNQLANQEISFIEFVKILQRKR
ncbi:hypothetical protein TREPR_0626 [Treponema primitia ZAS-2]|uniref:Uncharacterized protein n=1 Tax=Treponema primitia (strain ATCC BAA-887 / DSM 12427 / ZAS-2) TaxID=545694 RepID=F5YKL8_TREPZ|nr:hypothetical protein [Treponema primitia]AEF86366.1 hypothetical protein TREPR_0626 [Treponema primitia ZAS-2]